MIDRFFSSALCFHSLFYFADFVDVIGAESELSALRTAHTTGAGQPGGKAPLEVIATLEDLAGRDVFPPHWLFHEDYSDYGDFIGEASFRSLWFGVVIGFGFAIGNRRSTSWFTDDTLMTHVPACWGGGHTPPSDRLGRPVLLPLQVIWMAHTLAVAPAAAKKEKKEKKEKEEKEKEKEKEESWGAAKRVTWESLARNNATFSSLQDGSSSGVVSLHPYVSQLAAVRSFP